MSAFAGDVTLRVFGSLLGLAKGRDGVVASSDSTRVFIAAPGSLSDLCSFFDVKGVVISSGTSSSFIATGEKIGYNESERLIPA